MLVTRIETPAPAIVCSREPTGAGSALALRWPRRADEHQR